MYLQGVGREGGRGGGGGGGGGEVGAAKSIDNIVVEAIIPLPSSSEIRSQSEGQSCLKFVVNQDCLNCEKTLASERR